MSSNVIPIDSLKARASGYLHFCRKIGGGRAYQEASVDSKHFPDEGYECYHSEPLYTAGDMHEFLIEFQEMAVTEMLGEEAGAYGPNCETCKGVGRIGIPGGPCFACKGKGYVGKPGEHSTYLMQIMAMIDKHGAYRWETGFEEASPVGTERGVKAGRQALTARRRIELFLRSIFVKELFK